MTILRVLICDECGEQYAPEIVGGVCACLDLTRRLNEVMVVRWTEAARDPLYVEIDCLRQAISNAVDEAQNCRVEDAIQILLNALDRYPDPRGG